MHRQADTTEIEPEPVWELARLFPGQGVWDEDEYHALDTNHFIEFTDGYIEVLPMPTTDHQDIVLYLYHLLYAFVTPRRLGEVKLGPTKIKTREGQLREPDIFLLPSDKRYRRTKHYYAGAILTMEVVSEDPRDHERDYKTKRDDYAKAGIREYWIVDPQEKKIIVLRLKGDVYMTHSEAGETGIAASALLERFEVDAAAVWAAADHAS